MCGSWRSSVTEAARPEGLVEGDRYDTCVTLRLPAVISPPRDDNPKSQCRFEVFSEARAANELSVTVRIWA
jgi:hypothetical protein